MAFRRSPDSPRPYPLVAALAATFVYGCTLVSGWSDLQGGSVGVPPHDAGATRDANAGVEGTDGSVSPTGSDAAAVDGAGSPDADDDGGIDLSVACGSTRCPVGQGCCLGVLGAGTCQANSTSCSIASTFVTCSDSAACSVQLGHSAQCCATTGSSFPTISCRTTCASTDAVVCDPLLLSPGCDAGQSCVQASQEFDYDICQ